jgi:hypothetical protein
MHHGHSDQPLNTLALSATLHCFTGCAIGEVLGMAIGTALAWSNPATTVASIILAFAFGYALTIRPLIAGGVPLGRAGRLAFASDTLSITTMEIVDTAIIVVYPGALDAGLTDALFWGSLVLALFIAFWAAYPVNRWLLARGRGHAVVHAYH